MTVENGSSSFTRRINSTGMSAAPVTATRRLDRAYLPRSGWSRMGWERVVGPDGGRAPDELVPLGRGAAGEEVVPRMRPCNDDRLQLRQLHACSLEHGDVVGAEEVGDRHQQAGSAASQDIGSLGALPPGV